MCAEEAAFERGRMVKPSRKTRVPGWEEMMGGHSDRGHKQTSWKYHKQDLSEEGAVLQTKHMETFYVGRDTISQTTIRNITLQTSAFTRKKSNAV